MSRVVAIADPHCGHIVGLTPSQYNAPRDGTPHEAKLKKIRTEGWNYYRATLRALKPIRLLIVCGDSIDGKGSRSGGTELIRTSLEEQVEMAAECIALAKAEHVVIAYGTSYHVSEGGEDWEHILAERVGADIGSHEWPRVNGVTFDVKHHIGSSGIPHGRTTAIGREMLWNEIWHLDEMQPLADWTLRAHVHFCEGRFKFRGESQVWGMTMPALQAMGSKYGARRCSGTVHFGLVSWDIDKKGNTTWQPHVKRIASQQAHAQDY